MKLIKRISIFLCCYILPVAIITISGCAKEYSYEAESEDVVVIKDPVVMPSFLPSCILCNTSSLMQDSTWKFTVEGALLCGIAEKAIIALERTSFTFFGPSSCSVDSGFVASVYLTEPLNSDKINVTAAGVSFYYYDRVKPSYILMSRSGDPYSFIIETYIHQTGIATGSFSGFGYTESGIRKAITGGRFKIKL